MLQDRGQSLDISRTDLLQEILGKHHLRRAFAPLIDLLCILFPAYKKIQREIHGITGLVNNIDSVKLVPSARWLIPVLSAWFLAQKTF